MRGLWWRESFPPTTEDEVGESVKPRVSRGNGGWVQKLLESGRRPEGKILQYFRFRGDDGLEKMRSIFDGNGEES